MMVTTSNFHCEFTGLSPEQQWSIALAVAQWLRSARAVVLAQERLLAIGAPVEELLRRRRADSADRPLAGLLRLAVTLVITHGRLGAADRRKLSPPASEATLHAVVAATAQAYALVLEAESSGDATPLPAIEMNIGDY